MTEEFAWTQPEWKFKANEWIRSEVTSLGLTAEGPIEQIHLCPWSTVFRVTTTSGDLFFKAVTGELVHEAGLTQSLARWRPEYVPRVLASDHIRGWLLMESAGASLSDLDFH